MTNSNFKKIYHELDTCFLDIKAEVLVSELLENTSLKEEDITVFCKSSFTRGFRRDIINTTLNVDGNKILVDLSRNGIYDALPQGIFHKPIDSKNKLTFSEVRQNSKKEERDARMLFAPIENDFFLHKVAIEQNEKKLARQFSNYDNSFLLDFWEIKGKVANEYVFSLAKLLPLAYKISKNKDLIAQCLSEILNEKVSIKKQYLPIVNPISESISNKKLGMNFTLTTYQTEILYPHYSIQIELSDIKNKKKYTKKGSGAQLISVFCEYFVPLEIDWDIKINFSKRKSKFTLDNERSFLGISTIL